jgi:hypothetical protein
MNQILNNIEKLVKENQIKMIPRSHFMLRTGIISVVGFLMLLAMVYALSLLIFIARRNGPPTVGMRDIFFNLDVLPILIILFSLIGMTLIEIMSRKYTFAYRWPSLILFLVIIVFVSGVSFAIDSLMLHDRMHDMLMRNKFDKLDKMYQRPFTRGQTEIKIIQMREQF